MIWILRLRTQNKNSFGYVTLKRDRVFTRTIFTRLKQSNVIQLKIITNFMISFTTKYNVILVNDYHRAHKEHKLILGLDLKKK